METRVGQVEVSLIWEAQQASHCDRLFFDRLNSWRDYFPGTLGEQLNVAEIDQIVSYQAQAGELVEPYKEQQVHRIKRSQFQTRISPGLVITPQRGRFYPRNLVSGISSYFEGDRRPLRCVEIENDDLLVDLNHPLSRYALKLEARLLKELEAKQEHGGASIDVPQVPAQLHLALHQVTGHAQTCQGERGRHPGQTAAEDQHARPVRVMCLLARR